MGNWEVDLSLIAPWLKEQDKETIIGVTVALNELRDVAQDWEGRLWTR